MHEYVAIIVAGVLFLFSLIGSFFVGKSKGKSVEQIKNTKENAEKEINISIKQNEARADANKDAIKIKDDVNRLDAGGAADKLRQGWTRD